ncbi:hypothetical protein JOQ06_029904 [Pogonophryne albipinna]|uniref:Uncharacterized protein n=1 Tax=Pogonophryne albipinna TaxID=1090488 RepID=A0AAD6AYH0_9TELE|nr:hypothetical protein JOQ06_029904 [Pogonophryne albipinna]
MKVQYQSGNRICLRGSNVKTDYGPLLHTLAEFGWLLTCVLPTPIIRHDSDGNLATKQVVFLQRPVRGQAAGQQRIPTLSVHSEVSNRSRLVHLEEGGFEQEEGKAEVTCM